MTVKELIEKLKELPEYAKVEINCTVADRDRTVNSASVYSEPEITIVLYNVD
jgi:hypothetical protein